MEKDSSLLRPPFRDQLVGVIDLQHGRAVHAVAGDRSRYEPVRITGGDAIELAIKYREHGLRRLYIADLDSIRRRGSNERTICELIGSTAPLTEILVDAGWNTSGVPASIRRIDVTPDAPIKWIVSTESAESVDVIRQACETIEPGRVALGLDYRHGKLISGTADDETVWVQRAATSLVRDVVILDLAQVGTDSGGATGMICRRIKKQFPEMNLYSGGGLRRAEDARRLQQSGCDYWLVATALHRLFDSGTLD